jgi:1D-myo-inositol-triphosphate 3-kinase
MDIKMGTRTFLEEEAREQERLMAAASEGGAAEEEGRESAAECARLLRADLMQKMVRIDPEAPTELERRLGGVTKFRYMQFREKSTTSASLGFRIGGVRLADEVDSDVPNAEALKMVTSEAQACDVLRLYTQRRAQVLAAFAQELRKLRSRFEEDPIARRHAFVRSSLFLIYSDLTNDASVHMIDFARCYDSGIELTHRGAWAQGNHEDGFLTGLDNLVRIFEELGEQILLEEMGAKSN